MADRNRYPRGEKRTGGVHRPISPAPVRGVQVAEQPPSSMEGDGSQRHLTVGSAPTAG